MSIATEKLEVIRQQVQAHLDSAEQAQLSPAQERELVESIREIRIGIEVLSIKHGLDQLFS